MLKKLQLGALGVIGFLLGFGGISAAANAIDPQDGSTDLAKGIYDAFAGGHKAYAAALALVLGTALVRKYLGGRIPALHTDAGATLLVLAGSYGSALAATLAAGGPLTLHMATTAGAIAFAAAGGYAAVKRLVIDPLAPHLPAWARGPVLWLFQHASDPTANNPDPQTVSKV
jgi:hypothetical protein